MGSVWYGFFALILAPSLTYAVQGYGIINATGELWRAQRKAGLKFFSGANLDIMIQDVLPEIYHESTRTSLIQHAEDRTVFDLQKTLHDLTTTVVGHMAYDVRSTIRTLQLLTR